MAKDELINLSANVWKDLTEEDTSAITIVHHGGSAVIIQAKPGDAPVPEDRCGLILTPEGSNHPAYILKKDLTELTFVASPTRVYALSVDGASSIYVQSLGVSPKRRR